MGLARHLRAGAIGGLFVVGAFVFTDVAFLHHAAEGSEKGAQPTPDPLTAIDTHSPLVPGSGRYFYPGSGNYKFDDGSDCSGPASCRFTAPRTPGGADTHIVRYRDGQPLTSGTCNNRAIPNQAIVTLQPRRNGTAQTRLNTRGESIAPGALFADDTYEWLVAQVCTTDLEGVVSTWYGVKTCSTVDDTDPTSNDNNISSYTRNPAQVGACTANQAVLRDFLVHYSMSYDDTSLTACTSTSPTMDPASFRTLTLVVTGPGSETSNAGLTTNVPAAPTIGSGTQTTCAGAKITVRPWDGATHDRYRFSGWGGACAGTQSSSCTVTMTRNTTVTAAFKAER